MKHITYIILASALLTCSSCSDFLEKYPKDSPSTTIPMSDDLAVAMTNGCYQSLQSMNLYNQRIWSMDICAGDSEAGGILLQVLMELKQKKLLISMQLQVIILQLDYGEEDILVLVIAIQPFSLYQLMRIIFLRKY